MVLSLQQNELLEYIRQQCEHFFPDGYVLRGNDVDSAFQTALERLEECLSVIALRDYHDANGNTLFSHLHADQYATLLYFFGNSLWIRSGNKTLCDKLMQLNRTLHTIFISYKCNLPDHFALGHAYGTILGNAIYHDYLVVRQGVTINTGTNFPGGTPPVLGKGLSLGAHAKIFGNKTVGDRVSIGAGAMVYQTEIPADSVVIRDMDGSTVIRYRRNEKCNAQSFFTTPI